MKKYTNKLNTNSIRFLAVDMVNHANSGHPGICLGAAPMMTELFSNHLIASAKDSKWINRDRFVMGAGHGSALFYSTLFHLGYDLEIKDLKKFRKVDSKTPGHPEFGHTNGVDGSSGPLGQGIGQAVGMAVAEKILADKFNTLKHKIIDHHTYVLTCDGDLQEGAAYEAMSFAGHTRLSKLIVLFDSNNFQLDGSVSDAYSEDLKLRCQSQKWNYILVKDGENRKLISKAIEQAKKSTRPTMIEVKTILGAGTTLVNTSQTHGAPISEEERDIAAAHFNHEESPFIIADDVKNSFKNIIETKKMELDKWKTKLKAYKNDELKLYKEFIKAIKGNYKIELEKLLPSTIGDADATRNYSPKIIETLSQHIPTLVAGSADLKKSTKVYGVDGNFPGRLGRNINYGVREFAMSVISNGIALHGGVFPIASTFFIFSDYARPAIRLSALQRLPIIYVFTHDSVAAGEDGPTHQPIEHITAWRSTPNVNFVRPADHRETVLAYNQAINETSRPTVIALSRQALKNVSNVTVSQFEKGAYIIKETKLKKPKLTIIATGSEVNLVLDSVKNMKVKDKIRIVSMPSMDNFDAQVSKFKKSIISNRDKTLFIEAGDCASGYKYAAHIKGIVNQFGHSGPGADVMKKVKMTVESVQKEIEKLIK